MVGGLMMPVPAASSSLGEGGSRGCVIFVVAPSGSGTVGAAGGAAFGEGGRCGRAAAESLGGETDSLGEGGSGARRDGSAGAVGAGGIEGVALARDALGCAAGAMPL
ncbi:hypothetical protein D7D52_25490 [Nocardia yunnanensis]|uniref:Uncharacterized protein n=1 Tax=Nocardia yunnanensis TaxID=2382165 RepID=A0A386ZHE8_9NOCA|nr:hypothetical protein D7D52_25490 [Nocardia yunnanensis]